MDIGAEEVPLTVSVTHVESGRGPLGQSHTMYDKYVLQVTAFSMVTETRHPYKEFEQLHAALNQFVRGLPSQLRLKLGFALPQLPSPSWHGYESAQVVEDRRCRLEGWLQKLLLQAEIVADPECRLLKFLRLHPAAHSAVRLVCTNSSGPWLCDLCEQSSAGEGRLALRHPAVEKGLLKVGLDAIQEDGTISPSTDLNSLWRVCVLLERIFATERVFAGGREAVVLSDLVLSSRIALLLPLILHGDAPLQIEIAACNSGQERCKTEGSQSIPSQAMDSLLAFARADLQAWHRALHAYLDATGICLLLMLVQSQLNNSSESCENTPPYKPSDISCPASAADEPMSRERFVAELLLRGLDAVVKRLLQSDLADGRRKLLNVLFASSDLFVRLTVGLLLGRLLCEADYEDAAKAEAGLQSLLNELRWQDYELQRSGLGLLLVEDVPWVWLCQLTVSSNGTVSEFALFLMAYAVQPSASRILQDHGPEGSLRDLALHARNPTVRQYAAKVLLAAYRGDEARVPVDTATVTELCKALQRHSELGSVKDEEHHASLVSARVAVRDQSSRVADVDAALCNACDEIHKTSTDAGVWRDLVVALGHSNTDAEHAELDTLRRLTAHNECCLTAGAAAESLEPREDPLPDLQRASDELAVDENKLQACEEQLAAAVHQKMEVARAASDSKDEQQHWHDAAVDAEEKEKLVAEGKDPSPDQRSRLRSHECWQRHNEVEQVLQLQRADVEKLDGEVQRLSEAIPSLKASVDLQRQHVQSKQSEIIQIRKQHAQILNKWGEVHDTRQISGEKLRDFTGYLQQAQKSIQAEAHQRQELRSSIRNLMTSLIALDDQLQCLDTSPE